MINSNLIDKLKDDDRKKHNDICYPDYEYLPSIISMKNRIIGIGDIHGDLNLAIDFLKTGKLIEEINETEYMKDKNLSFKIPIFNKNIDFMSIYEKLNKIILEHDYNSNIKNFKYFKWIGNDTYVVQVGDQIDRCRPLNNKSCHKEETTYQDENSDLLIMELFDCLHKIAIKTGGAVYSLVGNHEVMNFDANFDYVSYEGINKYNNDNENKNIITGIDSRIKTFNNMRKKFACTRNAIIIIGDFVFVHGGLASSLLSNYNVVEINHIVRRYLNNKFDDLKELNKHNKKNNIGKYEELKKTLKSYYKILHSSSISPLWYRKLAHITPDVIIDNKMTIPNNAKEECNIYFDPVVKHFEKYGINLQGLIIGHTPQFGIHNKGINTACGGKIMRIDIGASHAFYNILDNNEKNSENRKPQVVEILKNENNDYLIKILKMDK